MNKKWYESKTVQGIVLAVAGTLWGLWSNETEVSRTVIVAGLGWAGFGLRSALK